jgi:hypothetical protein
LIGPSLTSGDLLLDLEIRVGFQKNWWILAVGLERVYLELFFFLKATIQNLVILKKRPISYLLAESRRNQPWH